MSCEEYTELISAALDGALTPEERVRLDAHLRGCPACRALLDELSGLDRALEELNAPVPEGFAGRVMERVAREARPARRKTVYWKKLLPAAAVFALVVAGASALPHWNEMSVADYIDSSPAVSGQLAASGEGEGESIPQEQAAAYEAQTGSAGNQESRVQEKDIGPAPNAGLMTVDIGLSESDALILAVDRVSAGSGYERALTWEEGACRITLTDGDVLVEESTVSYTGLSANGKYYLFTWSWEGQSAEEAELYRYAVSLEDGSVIWRGESAPDSDGFDRMLAS